LSLCGSITDNHDIADFKEPRMAELPAAKIFIVFVFVLILISLGSAGWSLFRRGGNREETATVKALTVRVVLSIALLVVIMTLSALGVISPNG
jgi:hypothetical protein